MTLATRIFVSAIALGLAATAYAGDAFYNIPMQELKITEGSLPKRERVDWRAYVELERMQPRAALSGPGEVYVVGRLVPGGVGWGSESMPSAVPGPVPPPGAAQGPRDAIGPGLRLLLRGEAGKDLAGRLVVPNSDLSGMVPLRFTVPASAAKPEAKAAFHQGKIAHYESLLNRDIPGGAWFRHQVRLAQAEMRLPPTRASRSRRPLATRPRRRPDADLRTLHRRPGHEREPPARPRPAPAARPTKRPSRSIRSPASPSRRSTGSRSLRTPSRRSIRWPRRSRPTSTSSSSPASRRPWPMADETSRHDTPVLRWPSRARKTPAWCGATSSSSACR